MLILLSSSKTLSESKYGCSIFTIPQLLGFTEELVKKFRNCSVKDLETKMKISTKIAELTLKRFQKFSLPFTLDNSNPAIFSFKGTAYKFVELENYNSTELKFAQNHLRIMSGLYGVLRPLDLIQPYRLEMDLVKSFWKGKVNALLLKEKDEIVVNLASLEYFSVVGDIKKRVITPVFKEIKNGEPKIVTIYTKFARGMMANWIIKNQISDPEKLKEFCQEGYNYSSELSKGDMLVFVR